MVSAQGTGDPITADALADKRPQVNFSETKNKKKEGAGILRGKVYEFSKSQLSYLKRIPPLSKLHTRDCLENQHLQRNSDFTCQQSPFMNFILPRLSEGWSFTCCSLPTWYEKASRETKKALSAEQRLIVVNDNQIGALSTCRKILFKSTIFLSLNCRFQHWLLSGISSVASIITLTNTEWLNTCLNHEKQQLSFK